MLYVTTRTIRDAYTAHRAICEDFGPDGGRFVPFSLPKFTQEEIVGLKEKSFSETVAEILNMFFSSRLTSWDVDFCIGRNPLRVIQMNHRIAVAELWHNLDGKYDYILKMLSGKISENAQKKITSDWTKIAVYIAVLFGIYGQMLRENATEEDGSFDVSLLLGDFSEPISAWYAKKLGLPIGKIIFTGVDNSATWDFVHRGTFVPAGTDLSLQCGLERLIGDVFGTAEVARFIASCEKGLSYTLSEEQSPVLADAFFATVAGENRATATINSVYRTTGYISDPNTALCLGGLQDYRAKTGESRVTLVVSGETPAHYVEVISKATGLKSDKILKS